MITVKLANIPIQLNNRYPDVELLCREYETAEASRLLIDVTPEEIEQERRSQDHPFSDGYLESVCIYRKLSLELLRFDVFLLHASVVEVDGQGYAFLATSGTGKSTQTRLWLEHFGTRARVINGDKPLVRMMEDGTFRAYGTPWCGKDGININEKAPVAGVCFLKQAPHNAIRRLESREALENILRQTLWKFYDPVRLSAVLGHLDHFLKRIPVYELENLPVPEAARLSYDTMRRGAEETGL